MAYLKETLFLSIASAIPFDCDTVPVYRWLIVGTHWRTLSDRIHQAYYLHRGDVCEGWVQACPKNDICLAQTASCSERVQRLARSCQVLFSAPQQIGVSITSCVDL